MGIREHVRKEIGMAFKNLLTDKRRKYTVGKHRVGRLNAERPKFVFRCVPERLASVVGKLRAEQKAAVCSIGFGQLLEMKCGHLKRKLCDWLLQRVNTARSVLCVNGWELEQSAQNFGQIMGISDGGMHVELDGDKNQVSGYVKRFEATSRGINIKKLVEIVSISSRDDDEFKVAFSLFALYAALCPPGGVHISSEFLFSLTDVETIKSGNWASFCFGRLMDGITRYKEEKLSYVGGCLLYLQVYMLSAQFFFYLFDRYFLQKLDV
ncbi:hypothetical protein CISIN_1g047517mg [Citrus sinensis]|uniref:Aminotransferase-like plant mobile domain-containing protein n=1 Tax=Citrus sinensis TaxID=2711 RepID=A0A067EN24_CITSI|nr:hypothetical protein CISIN_1g047517mg [Citrus sinensis]